MKKPIELRWPVRGVSDDQSSGKQLPNTTPHAKNVRTLDPNSGRSQGAQRPGWADFTSKALHPGKAVDALASVSVDLPKIEYFGPGRSEILRVWGHIVPGLREALALDTDKDGNLYVLDAAGSFEKIGPDGEVDTTQSFFVPNTEIVVPRIQIDSGGNVYVATSHKAGYTGRLLRFERVEDGAEDDERTAFSRSWEFTGLWGIRDFRVGAGVCAISRFYVETALGSETPADIVVLGALFAPEPIELYVGATPDPISMIALNSAGEVLCAARENPDRGLVLGDENWFTPVELWSPHELEDVAGYGAARRLHSWGSAKAMGVPLINGSKVFSLPDRRWVQSSLLFSETEEISEEDGALSGGDGVYHPPTDLNARQLKPQNSWFLFRAPSDSYELHEIATNPPIYRTKGAGLNPTIEFLGTADNNLSTHFWSAERGTKSDTDSPADDFPNDDGLMPLNLGVVPKHRKAVYALAFLIRPEFSDTSDQVVFYASSADGYDIAVLMNTDDPYGNTPDAPGVPVAGKMTLFIGQHGASLMGDVAGTPAHDILSCDLTTADFDNPQGVALVVIQMAGSTDSTGPSVTNGESQFRVNGRTIDRFTILPKTGEGKCSGFGKNMSVSAFTDPTTLGEEALTNGAYSGAQLYVRGPYKGHLLEYITVLGSTSDATKPNEVPVGFAAHAVSGLPGDPASAYQYTDMSAEDYSVDPLAYTQAASELERLEGWLAHAWGCPNILKGGSAATVDPGTSGLQDMHPFGDNAASAQQPPQGSAAAGGLTLSEAETALLSSAPLLFKLGASGQVQWALAGSGHGLGVIAGDNGAVLAVGRHYDGSTVVAKRIRDLGRNVRTTGDDTWELEDDSDLSAKAVPGLAIDDAANLYWPREDAAYSALIDFVSIPTNGQQISLLSPDGTGTISYIFQTTVLAAAGVLIGADKFEAAINFAAAVNDSNPGGAQYGTGITKHISWKAAVETDGTDVGVRVTRIGEDGLAQITLPVAYTNLIYGDTPASATFPFGPHTVKFGSGINRRVEVRSGEDGSLLWTKPYSSGEIDTSALAIAIDPDLPLYPDNDPLEGFPEHVYIGQRNNVKQDGDTSDTPTGEHVQKLRQVERRQVIGVDKSPRRTVHTATCGGDFFVVEKGKAPKLVNNGHDVFNIASPFAKLWTYRQKVYGLDGQKYIRFNPKTLLMEEWKAEGAGKIPYGAKVAAVFAGCIVLGRTADDPHNFHLSERGNPDGWDTDPSVITPLSAFSGNSTGNLNFRKHDLVNCLIAARDDTLIIGGDQSITRLSSHPGTGGQLDNISTSEGLAFGDAHCVGPGGTVFAKTTNGGVLRIGTDGSLNRISLRSIERRLQDVDLSEYDIRMAWNFRQEGLHVVQVPKGTGERIVEHWFWDAKNDGWWPDEFSTTLVQPTSLAVFDGDSPGDRVIAMGCEDGWIRYETADAKNDGPYRIESEIVFGPLIPDGFGRARFSHLQVALSHTSDKADVRVFTDQVSDIVAGKDPFYRGTAGPGYRGYNMFQAAGNQAWVKLGNAALGESFSLETLYLRAKLVGKRLQW